MHSSALAKKSRSAACRALAASLAAGAFAAGIGVTASPASAFDADESQHCVQLYSPFNGRDVALGAEYAFRPPGTRALSLFAFAAARPYHKRTLERLRPHFALIYREVLYHGGGGLLVTAPIGGGLAVHGGAGLAYVFGDYAGTAQSPEDGWTPLLRAGLTFAPPTAPLQARIGYQYADLKSGGSSWAQIGIGVRF